MLPSLLLGITLTLTPTGLPPRSFQIDDAHEWNHVAGSLGVHTWQRPGWLTVAAWNAVADGDAVGTVEFEITVTADEPVDTLSVPTTWKYRESTPTITPPPGSPRLSNPPVLTSLRIPGIVVQPRGVWQADFQIGTAWAWPSRVSDTATLGDLQFPIIASDRDRVGMAWIDAIRSGSAPTPIQGWEMAGTLGPYFVLGNPIPNEGGGGVSPIPIAPDASTAILRARGHMHRMPVGCLRKADGMPVGSAAWPGWGYSLSGFTSRATTLPRFHEAMPGSSDPTKVQPKTWNAPTLPAPWTKRLMGERIEVGSWVTWDGGYNRHDGQHLPRVFAPLIGAAQIYGDPCAAFDLLVLQAEVRRAYPTAPLGRTAYGTREVAWSQTLLATTEDPLASVFSERAQAAQMPGNGCWAMFPWRPDNYSFIPSPWSASDAISTPLSTDWAVAQRMEQDFQGIAQLTTGDYSGAMAYLDRVYLENTRIKAITRKIGYAPKWVATGETVGDETRPVRRVVQSCGGQDFYPWEFLAAGAAAAPDPKPWFDAMLLLPVEGLLQDGKNRRATSLAELRWAFTSNPDTYNRLRYQAPMVLAVIP